MRAHRGCRTSFVSELKRRNVLRAATLYAASAWLLVQVATHAEDGRELWSQTYDRELKDIFALQSEIAQAVADSLKVTLLAETTKARLDSSTKSADAHDAYLQGHFFVERYDFDSYPKAIAFFNDAIRRRLPRRQPSPSWFEGFDPAAFNATPGRSVPAPDRHERRSSRCPSSA